MKLKETEGCECDRLDIKEKHPEGCTLNQVIKCHGNQPLTELFKHYEIDEKE